MSTDVEDQVRSALHEIARDARPAPLMQRLEASHAPPTPRLLRQQRVLGAVASVVAVLLVTVLAWQAEHRRRIEPVQQPPRVIRLSDAGSLSPGRALLAMSLAGDTQHDDTPAYVLSRGATKAVLLPVTGRLGAALVQTLSGDGSAWARMDWQGWPTPRMEIVDLITGKVDDLEGLTVNCPVLSPDGRVFAALDGEGVFLVDRGTQTPVRIGPSAHQCGYSSLGWSPDGARIAVRVEDGSQVRDRRGRLVQEIPGWTLANASMSWSPDGGDLLMYRSSTASYAIVSVDQVTVTRLRRPARTARAVGWTGDRVVWLMGRAGDQQLVTTDRDGGDRRPWTRLELGSRQVDHVSWSRPLTGRG
jgi:hypothetical protein